MTPIKDGKSTSTFFVTILGLFMTAVMPFALQQLEAYSRTLPPNSWLAILMPGVIALGYGILRIWAANNARDNAAKVETANKPTLAPITGITGPLMQGTALISHADSAIEELKAEIRDLKNQLQDSSEEKPVDSE